MTTLNQLTIIEQIFRYHMADINEAVQETDCTFIELMAEVQKNHDNDRVPWQQRNAFISLWVDDAADTILEYLKEVCPSSPIEEATAEAEYRADAAMDELWLRERTNEAS